uniref:Uncharacterized protein n=1 Tax=viral metagenome TaxID=1070528 RepID=A0A6C0AR15_9ZZZZ
MLHNVGKIKTFHKKCQKRGPTHVEANFLFFFQDFFGKVKNGHLFLSIFQKSRIFPAEKYSPLHKKFLSCKTKKKIFNLLR